MTKLINVFFKVLIFGIVIATIFIDKNVSVKYPNRVQWDNAGYFLIAFCLLGIIGYFICQKKDIDEKKWKAAIIIITLITGILQLIISLWVPTKITADFQYVRKTAIALASGATLEKYTYFQESPNNINITLILAVLYKIFGKWRIIIFIGSLLTNFSVVLMTLTVSKITKSRWSSLVLMVTGEILVALTWRAFLPYTDNFGMIFVALMIWLYMSEIRTNVKMPLVILTGVAGAFVKETVMIVLLAIGIHAFFVGVAKKNSKRFWIKVGIAIALFLFGMFVSKYIQKESREYLQYEAVSTSKGWTYMFMVGQNDEYYGVVNKADRSLRREWLQEYSEGGIKEAFLKEALTRIKNRGFIGNIKYYLMKLNVAYNDGYFHNMSAHEDKDVEKNRLYLFYLDKNSKTYALGASVMQVLWDMILALLIFNTFVLVRKHKSEWTIDLFAEIAILGITLYLMLFEGRAKYIYMLLPVYLYYAGIIMARFWLFCKEVKESGILKGEKKK